MLQKETQYRSTQLGVNKDNWWSEGQGDQLRSLLLTLTPWILTSIHPVPDHLAREPETRVHILNWHIIHVIHMTQWFEYDPQAVNVRHQTNFHSISWPASRWQTTDHVTGYNEIRESWPTGFIVVIKAHEDHLWQDEVCHLWWQEAAWSWNYLYEDCLSDVKQLINIFRYFEHRAYCLHPVVWLMAWSECQKVALKTAFSK